MSDSWSDTSIESSTDHAHEVTFLDLITSKEENQAKEEDNFEEEEKVIISKDVGRKERWIQHYSSSHRILLVGEGDFSFSASLARAFGSASNMVATSLDTKDVVIKNYKEAKSNLEKLEKLGACILHGVDATKMKLYTDLQMRKFDRIIFNFPHAGFHGKEDDNHMIGMHKCLLYDFFGNARGMLSADGETHVNHKITMPFCRWNLEELASQNSLALIEYVDFKKEDYPGYNNKRGAGSRCDEPFPLGECSTFKFSFSPTAKKKCRAANLPVLTHRPQQLRNIPISMQGPPTSPVSTHRPQQLRNIPISMQGPPTSPVSTHRPQQLRNIPISMQGPPTSPVSTHRPQQLQKIPISMQQPPTSLVSTYGLQQLQKILISMQLPPTSLAFRYPQTNFTVNVNDGYSGLPSSISDSHNCFRCFHGHFSNEVGTFGRTNYDVGYSVPEEQRLGVTRYMAETLGRTDWNGYMYHSNQLQHSSILRSSWLSGGTLDHNLYARRGN